MKRWRGNKSLARRLKPVEELSTHPKNPRIGNVEEIAKSLERFGQQRAGLALPDGTLVSGNHTFKAAVSLGWTHFACDASDLDEAEAEAYLVADNRLADLGGYDLPKLHKLVVPQLDSLDGIGYTRPQVAALGAAVARARPQPPKPKADDVGVREMNLLYDEEEYESLVRWLKMIGREWGTHTMAETVYRMSREVASAL